MKSYFFLFLLLALLPSCNDLFSGDNKTLRIEELNKDISTTATEVEAEVATLVQVRNSINLQGRALLSEEMKQVAKIDNIEATFLLWKEGFNELDKVDFSNSSQYIMTLKKFQKNLNVIKMKIKEAK